MTAACPACVTSAPVPRADSKVAGPDGVVLHLPDIHCAGCVRGVEEALAEVPGVRAANVNLTLKRAMIDAPGVAEDTLISALSSAGHRSQRLDASRLAGGNEVLRDLALRIGVAGFAMMNVMLLSVAVWSGAAETTARLFHYISAAITVPAVVFSARPFFVSAFRALGGGRLNMDVPIALAIALATGVSLATTFGGVEEAVWYDAALALTFFLLIGRYFDLAGRSAARSAAAELAALEPPQALRVIGERREIVAAEALMPGDLIEVRPGDRLPADGVIISGRTDIDRAAMTGETQPVAAGVGDVVVAGETNLTGLLSVRIEKAGEDTALARMAALVATAESQRTHYTGLADRAAGIYAPLVHVLSAATFAGWWVLTGDPWRAVQVAIAVLVITCPCALGLAVPAVSTVVTGRLFKAGVLVKSRTALERLSEIDIVAFDKTGTLTTGTPKLETGLSDEVLSLAAGLATGSSHPISRAILRAAEARGVATVEINDIVEIPGFGVEGRLGGRRVRLGRGSWISRQGHGTWIDSGTGAPIGLRFSEVLAPGAEDAVNLLRQRGLRIALLSGDEQGAVESVAQRLGIEEAMGGLVPAEKIAWLDDRALEGHRVLMVGDGLNDTGSLASAHASMAPGSAVDAARLAADCVILNGDLHAVPQALAAAKDAILKMRQNIGLAVAYNAIAIPVAIAGLASPMIAAIAMSSSSLTVTANSARAGR